MRDINLETKNIFIAKALSKRSMLRNIWENDYDSTDIKHFGRIFAILDIHLGPAENNKIFDIINEGVARYYKSHQEYDIAFDNIISFLNRRIIQLIDNKNIKDFTNIVIGLLKKDTIMFSATGMVHAYFIYSQGVKKIYPDENVPLDVTNKLFTYSLNGEIDKGQTIYFCNQDFNQSINPFYLEKALKIFNTDKVISALQDSLLADGHGCYSAFFFSSLSGIPSKDTDAKEDILEMIKKHDRVQSGLSPSIINNLKNFVKQKSFLAYIAKYLFLFLKRIFEIIKKGILFFAFLLFNSFFILTNARGKRKEKSNILNAKFGSITEKLKDIYRSLTATSKIILLSAFTIIIILIILISYNLQLREFKELKAQNSKKIILVENLSTEADANLLFNERRVAIEKLNEALSILNDVPEKIRDNEYLSLYQNIKNKLNKVQNIYEVTSLSLILDMSIDGEFEPLSTIILDNDRLFVPGKNSIVSIDTSGKKYEKKLFTVKGLESGTYFYYEQDEILYSYEAGSILQASNIKNLTSQINDFILNSNENIKKFTIFNDRLYAASANDKQLTIWKHSKSLSGFGKPVVGLNDNIPINSLIQAIRIDGNIYVLFSNNEIYKYYKGQRDEWNYDLGSIPNEAKYFDLITNDTLEYIYLISKQQISILSKNGDFLAHIFLPNIEKIKNISIDEKNKTIYLLSGEKIYAFAYTI